jgi:hypothetical protein
MSKDRTVNVKRHCCKDSPRCKRCPVVARRLERAGLADRVEGRTYVVRASKKAVKAARH